MKIIPVAHSSIPANTPAHGRLLPKFQRIVQFLAETSEELAPLVYAERGCGGAKMMREMPIRLCNPPPGAEAWLRLTGITHQVDGRPLFFCCSGGAMRLFD